MSKIKELIEQGDLAWEMLKDAEVRKDSEQVDFWNQLWLDAQLKIRNGDYDEAIGRYD